MYRQSRYALQEMCELFIVVLVTCYDGCSATSSHDQIWKENNDMSKVLCNCDPEPITLDPPHQQIDLYQIANKGFVKSMTRYMLVKWANPCPSKVESWTRRLATQEVKWPLNDTPGKGEKTPNKYQDRKIVSMSSSLVEVQVHVDRKKRAVIESCRGIFMVDCYGTDGSEKR